MSHGSGLLVLGPWKIIVLSMLAVFVSRLNQHHCTLEKEKKINFSIERNTQFRLTYKCTKETRLWVLQWKILHYTCSTNTLLWKMKVRNNNNNCSYCLDTADVIEYVLPIVSCTWILEILRRIYFMRSGIKIKL